MLIISIIFMIMPFVWIAISDYSNHKIITNLMQNIGQKPINLAFENLTLKILQQAQKSLVLQAPFARIHDLNISKIDLKNPYITLYQPNQPNTILSAKSGHYKAAENHIALSDHVLLSSDPNYKLKTNQLFVDLKNLAITIPNNLNATYKNNSLKAKNVEFYPKSNKAIFKGGIKLIIMPNPS